MLPPLIWPPVSLRNERLFKPMSFTATRYCSVPSGFLRLRTLITLIFWPQGCNMALEKQDETRWNRWNSNCLRVHVADTCRPQAFGMFYDTRTTHAAGGIAGSSKAVASPNDQCDGHREHGEQNHLRKGQHFATVQDCPSSNSYHQLSSCHVVICRVPSP